jgi:hypothetical protein
MSATEAQKKGNPSFSIGDLARGDPFRPSFIHYFRLFASILGRGTLIKFDSQSPLNAMSTNAKNHLFCPEVGVF